MTTPAKLARSQQMDAWLADSGIVLAASERAARSLRASFHAARLAEGSTAWPSPAIFSWDAWLKDMWQRHNRSGLVLLNPLQEQSLWMRVIVQSRTGEGLLHPARLADASMRAYGLLCDYAPSTLPRAARLGWQGDAAVFSEWLDEFESRCRRDGLVSASHLTLELTPLLRETAYRAPLLLIGFDRLLATQQALLNAWGVWQLEQLESTALSVRFFAAPDSATEVEACVDWLRATLRRQPEARLLVIASSLQPRRGELERALLATSGKGTLDLDFEFSLGVPLSQVALVRSALLLLRWLQEPLTETELDWLIGSGCSTVNADEEIALAKTMHDHRSLGRERPEWSMEDFTSEISWTAGTNPASSQTPQVAWTARLLGARDRLLPLPSRQSPMDRAALASELLDSLGWPGHRPLSSFPYQARQRWDRILENCASLAFDGSLMDWRQFLSTLSDAVSATTFAAESMDAPIQITEPLESAGQLAEGIWFLGADDESWPSRGQPHPLLPIALQREAAMPHSSPQADWDLAYQATVRLVASAEEVVFSYARQSAESETRPSRLVLQHLGSPRELPPSRKNPLIDRSETVEDTSQIPYPHSHIRGGAAILTRQSLCPFQAFATTRLSTENWDFAKAGLTPMQRGQLLHSVLRDIWAGPKLGGLSGLADLQAITDLKSFVGRIVVRILYESFDQTSNQPRRNSLSRRFAPRYLELEAQRLTSLVTEWLAYERQRLPFTVSETEVQREVTIAGLTLRLRLDRIDVVEGGGRLVLDYKSSLVGPGMWIDKQGRGRPDDVQLPLYATFAVPDQLEGLAFARIRPGDTALYGRLRNAATTLLAGLDGKASLVRNPLSDQQLAQWQDQIEQLGSDFISGRAAVDPKDPAKTCKSCHLHAVCRIYEQQLVSFAEEEEEPEGGEDA